MLLSEIVDWTQFDSSRQSTVYAGVTPRERTRHCMTSNTVSIDANFNSGWSSTTAKDALIRLKHPFEV
jgi:hypothetical protein